MRADDFFFNFQPTNHLNRTFEKENSLFVFFSILLGFWVQREIVVIVLSKFLVPVLLNTEIFWHIHRLEQISGLTVKLSRFFFIRNIPTATIFTSTFAVCLHLCTACVYAYECVFCVSLANVSLQMSLVSRGNYMRVYKQNIQKKKRKRKQTTCAHSVVCMQVDICMRAFSVKWTNER